MNRSGRDHERRLLFSALRGSDPFVPESQWLAPWAVVLRRIVEGSRGFSWNSSRLSRGEELQSVCKWL